MTDIIKILSKIIKVLLTWDADIVKHVSGDIVCFSTAQYHQNGASQYQRICTAQYQSTKLHNIAES